MILSLINEVLALSLIPSIAFINSLNSLNSLTRCVLLQYKEGLTHSRSLDQWSMGSGTGSTVGPTCPCECFMHLAFGCLLLWGSRLNAKAALYKSSPTEPHPQSSVSGDSLRLWFSCLKVPSARIIDTSHHTWPQLSIKLKHFFMNASVGLTSYYLIWPYLSSLNFSKCLWLASKENHDLLVSFIIKGIYL